MEDRIITIDSVFIENATISLKNMKANLTFSMREDLMLSTQKARDLLSEFERTKALLRLKVFDDKSGGIVEIASCELKSSTVKVESSQGVMVLSTERTDIILAESQWINRAIQLGTSLTLIVESPQISLFDSV